MISREWVNYLDLSEVDLHPIQFVNCDRLSNNDVVYIFDEVGSGKTISSGLMALDYLYNNPQKEILVVTTNVLAKGSGSSEYGQFLCDWYKKLPFCQLGLECRIHIVNNHTMNLDKYQEVGLVIVDEAQLFLNKETQRYQSLKAISAEKIVFLSATPIKNSCEDLNTYVELAKQMLGKDSVDTDWMHVLINGNNKDGEEIICSEFEPKRPVTRYFKDSIRYLRNEKAQARRMPAEIWTYSELDKGSRSKNQALADEIKRKLEENNSHRFVVFTRLVDKEAYEIADFLVKNGVASVKVITGANSYELSRYSGTKNVPVVLILTYQIAEQGVNLPGYDHVVNYHISAFPSALEQRFGRIDRLGKAEEDGSAVGEKEIYMCFLISKNYWDTNTANFYSAIGTYLRNLIPYIPSKNTILTETIIDILGYAKVYAEEYVNKLQTLCVEDGYLDAIIEYFKGNAFETKYDKELLEFIEEKGIRAEEKDELINAVQEALKEYIEEIYFNQENLEEYKQLIRRIGNKIFYFKNQQVETIDAICDCGKIIEKNTCYEKYKEALEMFELLKIELKYRQRLNAFFERKFIENDFYALFPEEQRYKSVLEEFFIGEGLQEKEASEMKLMLDNSDVVVAKLPVFKLFGIFEKELLAEVSNDKDGLKQRFDVDVLQEAFHKLYKKALLDENGLGLSVEFFDMYFGKNCVFAAKSDPKEVFDAYKEIYGYTTDENDVLHASNWYKLAYQYLGSWYVGERSLFQYCIYTESGRRRNCARIYMKGYVKNKELSQDRWTQGIVK